MPASDVELPARRSCRSVPPANRSAHNPRPPRRALAPSAAPSLSASGVSTSLNLSRAAHRPATADNDLRGGQFGPVVLSDLAADVDRTSPLSAAADNTIDSIAALPDASAAASKPVVRTVTTLTLVASMLCTSSNGVAGVDRPLEGVGRDHLGGVADLCHVELARPRAGLHSCPCAVAGNSEVAIVRRRVASTCAATCSQRGCSCEVRVPSACSTFATPGDLCGRNCGGPAGVLHRRSST